MPTLLKFLTVIAVLGGLAYGAMFALASLVEPDQREMVQPVAQERLKGK